MELQVLTKQPVMSSHQTRSSLHFDKSVLLNTFIVTEKNTIWLNFSLITIKLNRIKILNV